MVDIDVLINDLKSCKINTKFIEEVICEDFKHLVDFYIKGECVGKVDGIVFEPQPNLEMYEDIAETIQHLGYGRGYLILNTEIEKEMVRRNLWNTESKINLFHNQDIVQTLVDYYIDLLQNSS